MNELLKTWEKLRSMRAAVAIARLIFWLAPFVIAGITYFSALTERLPTPWVITLSLVTLVAAITFINQLATFFGRPALVRFKEDYAFSLALIDMSFGFEPW